MIARILIAFVRVYQRTLSILLRGAFGPVCRFEPSCSHYALACLEGHGALRGSLLSVKRLCRCSPFHPGGFDPPPPPDPRRGRITQLSQEAPAAVEASGAPNSESSAGSPSSNEVRECGFEPRTKSARVASTPS